MRQPYERNTCDPAGVFAPVNQPRPTGGQLAVAALVALAIVTVAAAALVRWGGYF